MIRFADARALARAAAAAALSFAVAAASPASAATITISDTTFSGNQTICPRADAAAPAAVPVNAFQVAATADVALGRVQVRLAPAGGYTSIERVEIRSADLATVYGAIVPNADLFWISMSTPLPAPVAAASYRIAIVPRRHADMPPPSVGKAVAVQAFLMGAIATTTGHTITGNDLASATVTIDNLSPANVVWSGVTSGASVQLSWASPADVVVLKRALGPVEDVPVEGQAYATNATLGTSQVAFAGNAASFSDAAVTPGQPYYYRVFTRSSACGNFSSGSALGPVYAGGSTEGDLTVNSTKPVLGIVSPVNGPVTRPFKVQVRVYSPNTLPITEVRLYGNQSGTEQLLASTTGVPAALTRNANYDSGPVDPASGFYEFTAPAGFAEGTWTLRAWAANVASPQLTDGVYSGGVGVNVSANVGDGRLLVRDNSSQMCADCHAVKTHSSETVGMGLGSWFVGCRGCHDPHGTTNAKLIAKEITPPSVNGAQAPQQIFYSGAAGNVNGGKVNPSGTGLCQACHTRTTFYSRGAINQTHGDGQPCASCHKHEQGLGASCSSCHGDPGRNTAGGDSLQAAAPPRGAPPEYETATTTNAVGKHVAHVSGTTYRGAALACSECHTMPNAHNGTVEAPSFPNLARADGASPSYAAATCSNTYCHAGPPARNFLGTNRNPSWTAAATIDCQSCHASPPAGHQAGACTSCHGAGYELTGLTGGARATHIDGTVQATNCTGCHGTDGVNAAPPVAANAGNANAVGAHQAHVTKTNVRTSALVCSDCHADFANSHNNGSQNVVFSALGTFGGMAAQYQGIVTPANPTCTSTYCHAGAPGGTTPAPNWTTAGTLGCNSCHGNAPGYPHPGNTTCADCHPSAGAESYTRTGATTGTVVKATHLDTSVQRSTSGCTSCHGTLSATGVNLVVNTSRAAPGYDAAGSEDTVGGTTSAAPGVGAHRTHLTSTAIRSGGAAACTECHALPPTDTDTSHAAGGGTGGARATLAFPSMGGLTGAYSASTSGAGGATAGNCSNTYCHGGKFTTASYQGATPAPSWTGGQMTCASCHQAPPATSAHAAVPSTRNCGDCHLNYNCTSGNLAACTVPAEHLNVLADAPSLSCSRCHGTTGVAVATTLGSTDTRLDAAPPRDAAWLTGTNQVGPHQAHVNPTQAAQIMRPIACAECHGSAVNSYANTHSNGTTEVTFANATSANLRGHTPTQTTGNPWSCNTYCHDAATATGGSVAGWTWNTTTTATCGSCHGSPPSGAVHVSVGTNQPATACYACHNTTVTSGGTIAFTGTGAAAATQHIDGTADLGGVSCHSCHGSVTNDAPPVAANTANGNAIGAHQSHVVTGTVANALACTICHPAVAPTAYGHANGTVNMSFTGTAATGTVWNAATPATSNCSTSWCHGGAAAQASWGRAQPNPLWNDATDNFKACNACHGSVPPIAARHPQNTLSACSVCHGTGYATTGITGGALATHVNGTVEPRTGCTACHGNLSLGSGQTPGVSAAPGNNGVGVDSHGNSAVTVRTVGAHDAHVRGTTFRTAALACSECHFNAVPAAGDTTHVNGTIAIAGGALALDPSIPATTAAALTWNGTTCSNTYCHGNFKNGNNLPIAWAQNPTLTCNSCHGRGTGATATPPGGTHLNRTDCATCHPDYTVAANLGTHLDGNLDMNGTGCNLCHGEPPAVSASATENHPQNLNCQSCHGTGYTDPISGGALTTHQNGSTVEAVDMPRNGCTACHGALAGPTGAAVTTAAATSAPGYGGTGVDTRGNTASTVRAVGAHNAHVSGTTLRSAALPCSECHNGAVPAYPDATHANSVVATGFGTLASTGGAAGTWNGASCGTTYCHGQGLTGGSNKTPSWTGGASQATCGTCHQVNGTSHYGTDCQGCHGTGYVTTGLSAAAKTTHLNGSVESPGATCVLCHNGTMNIQNGPLAGQTRRPIVPEFKLAWSHKASTNATPANRTVSNEDCAVCHMEGTPKTGARTSSHADGYVDLRDPDTGTTILEVVWGGTGAGAYSNKTPTTYARFTRFSRNLASDVLEEPVKAIMINQCLKCHDANGATHANAQVTSGTATKPFNTTIAGTNYNGGTGLTACATGTNGCVVNVDASFSTANASYHPIKGKQNNWYAKSTTRMKTPWNATRGGTVDITSWGDLLSCWDCHAANNATGTITQTVTAHGGATTLRQDIYVVSTVSNGAVGAGNLCIVCHNIAASGSQTHGTGSAWQTTGHSTPGGRARDSCFVCHSSADAAATSARPIRAEDAHGFNTFRGQGTDLWWPVGATETHRPYAFMRNVGTGNSWSASGNNWRPLTAGTELTSGTPTCAGNCGRGTHGNYTPGGRF